MSLFHAFFFILLSFIFHQCVHFQYYHPIDNKPAKTTYLRDFNGWNEEPIRNQALTKDEITKYHRDGYKVIRNAIPAEIVDTLYAKKPKHSLSPYLHWIESLILSVTNSHFMFDCLWTSVDEYRDFWFYSPLIELYVSPIMPNVSIRLLTDMIFGIKGKPLKLGSFHQDIQSYNMIDAHSKGVSVWIPLMDINASNGGSIVMYNQSLSEFIVINESEIEQNAVVIEYFHKGDILLFDKFSIHKSQPLVDGDERMRFAYGARFIDGDNAYFNDTFADQIMPKKNVCKHEMERGDLIKSPCYPHIYPELLKDEMKVIMANELQFPSNDLHFLMSLLRSLLNLLSIDIGIT